MPTIDELLHDEYEELIAIDQELYVYDSEHICKAIVKAVCGRLQLGHIGPRLNRCLGKDEENARNLGADPSLLSRSTVQDLLPAYEPDSGAGSEPAEPAPVRTSAA